MCVRGCVCVCVRCLFYVSNPHERTGEEGGGGSRSCFQPLFLFRSPLVSQSPTQRRTLPDNYGVHSHGCCLNIKIHSHFSFHRPFVTCFFSLPTKIHLHRTHQTQMHIHAHRLTFTHSQTDPDHERTTLWDGRACREKL